MPENRKSPASTSHVIRLHGPWQCEVCSSTSANLQDESPPLKTTEVLTVKLPVDWIIFFRERHYDSMKWTRGFGRPTNLQEAEQVELVISPLRTDVSVRLNEIELTADPRNATNARFNVTNRLDARNRLVLEVDSPRQTTGVENYPAEQVGQPTAAPFGEIHLEIRTASCPSQ